jgi:hypothetical protein
MFFARVVCVVPGVIAVPGTWCVSALNKDFVHRLPMLVLCLTCTLIPVGGIPDNGRKAAEESRKEIHSLVEGSDLVFITAGTVAHSRAMCVGSDCCAGNTAVGPRNSLCTRLVYESSWMLRLR